MNRFSGFAIFDIILIILATGLLLKDLYTIYHHGKFIVKIKQNKVSTIFWIVMLIVWFILLWGNIRLYIHHEKNSVIDNIFMNIFWIELSISYIIKAFTSSGIRENGIYKSGYFYKWSKIQSYNWVLPNTIQFKVNAFFKTTRSLELIINEEFKLKVDEVIQRKLPL